MTTKLEQLQDELTQRIYKIHDPGNCECCDNWTRIEELKNLIDTTL